MKRKTESLESLRKKLGYPEIETIEGFDVEMGKTTIITPLDDIPF